MHPSEHFSEMKIRELLKFEGLLFTLPESRRTSGFAERVVDFTDTQMHLLAKIYSLKIPF
jgi:hypothetical protein